MFINYKPMVLLNKILSNKYYVSIPDDDLIAKQRYKLFRAFSMASFLVCTLFTVQTLSIFNIENPVVFMITTIGILLALNFYLLPIHQNVRLAYVMSALLSLTLLHVQTYYSGGIRASGTFYLSAVILMSFMLLGNKIGRLIAIIAAAQIAYFFCISNYHPEWINYLIVGESKEMIDVDFLFTGIFSILILTAQINYLESGKNIVIQRITQSRNELREKNRELKKLSIVASKADNAIGIINSKGSIEWVNDGFVRLTGYSFEEALGKNLQALFQGKDSDPAAFAAKKKAIEDKQNFSAELLKYHKNGTKFWTQVTMTPINTEEEKETKFIFIESDITTRKIAEQKMKAYLHSLEKSNAELDKFAYVVSHDLKAPLRAIGNLTGCIEEDFSDTLPTEALNHFNTIKNRVSRMEGLINGILDYAKANKNTGNVESFKSDDLVKETIELIGVPENAIINIREGMPSIQAEKIKLQQVFMNIINNAIKYNDKTDIQVEVGSEDYGNEWMFYVKDNGPGIEPRYHDKIFIIFQTLNARDEVESRGVGLAIVKKIIEDEGGKISIDSDLERGAKFIFTWPKVKKKTADEMLMIDSVTLDQ